MLTRLRNKIPIQVANELEIVAREFDISNHFRVAHLIAQSAYESRNFKYTRENLNYPPQLLLKYFPNHFSPETAPFYANKQEAIANVIYAHLYGNGDKNSGDGWKYRGRGYISKIKGKKTYQALGDFIGDDLINNPDLVATKYPLISAAWIFEKNKLWQICDDGVHMDNVRLITQKLTGGTLGLIDRYSKTNVIFNL